LALVSILVETPPTYLYKGILPLAAALATAKETPKIAFTPKLDLFYAPSKSIINLSI
jgi:hypothetical protein